MTLFDRIRLLLRLKSLVDTSEKEIRMNNWNWQITLKKALISLLTHGTAVIIAALAVVPDSGVHEFLLSSGFPPTVVAVATPVAMMLIRGGANWWKHSHPELPAPPDAS